MGTTGGGEVLRASSRDAGELLGAVQRVSKEARRARHGYWFPLLFWGVIIAGSVPFYPWPGSRPINGLSGLIDSGTNTAHSWGLSIYWMIALPLGYVITAGYYIARGRRRGIQGRFWLYVVMGLALFTAFMLSNYRLGHKLLHLPYWFDWARYSFAFNRGGVLTPLLIIAFGLVVLPFVEKSWVVGLISIAFLAGACLINFHAADIVQRVPGLPDWSINEVVPAAFLIITGLIAGLAPWIRGSRHATSG